MEKMIIRLGFLHRSVHAFEELVNRHLQEGWRVKTVSVNKDWLRLICVAVLERPDRRQLVEQPQGLALEEHEHAFS